MPTRGITTQPEGFFPIDAAGRAQLIVQFQPNTPRGQIVFTVDGVQTVLRLTSARIPVVAAHENANAGGAE